jgi:ribosome-binding protein aMBF1 (putative translation factor)
MSDPEILRPIQALPTQRQCELYKSAVASNQLDRYERLDRENRQRAAQGGALVKALREKRGWTREQLAQRADLKANVIAEVELADSPYSLSHDRAFKLARALGVESAELTKWSWHAPRNIVSQLQCWPDSIDPRGPKTK